MKSKTIMNDKQSDINKVIQGIKFMDADGYVNTGRHIFKVSHDRREVVKCDGGQMNKGVIKILKNELEKLNYTVVWNR